MLLFGAGAGLSFPSLMTLAMSGATSSDSGIASGLANTSLQVGGALGLSVLSTVAAARSGQLLAAERDTPSAPTAGYHLAFGVGAAFVVVAIVLAATVLRSQPAAVEEDEPSPDDPDEQPAADAFVG